MAIAHRWLYGIMALLWIAVGLAAVVGLLAGDAPVDEVHAQREAGAGFVLVGCMHAWCAHHQDQRRPVHRALLLFAALFAAIHWYEWAVGRRGIASPLFNSLPLLALAAMLPEPRGAAAH